MSATTVRACTCAHAAQDRLYGVGQRLHNAAKAQSGGMKWRCTVCSREKEER